MKHLPLILIITIATFTACHKSKSSTPSVTKTDTVYSYNQCIQNLGIVYGKQYTIRYIDTSIHNQDTIVFNQDSTITETRYQTSGTNVGTDFSGSFPTTIAYDSDGIYEIHYPANTTSMGSIGFGFILGQQIGAPANPINPIFLKRIGNTIQVADERANYWLEF